MPSGYSSSPKSHFPARKTPLRPTGPAEQSSRRRGRPRSSARTPQDQSRSRESEGPSRSRRSAETGRALPPRSASLGDLGSLFELDRAAHPVGSLSFRALNFSGGFPPPATPSPAS